MGNIGRPKGTYWRTEEKAKRVKEWYISGIDVKEVVKNERISLPSYFRLLKLAGGYTDEERATHYQNKANIAKAKYPIVDNTQ